MTSRSFKPTSLSLRPQRPSYTRSSSNSSAHSIRSQNQERPLSSCSNQSETSNSTTPVQEPLTSATNRKVSRPIAIELPAARKSSTQINSPTPPAPLSGRGEKLGGYFPFHEEIQPQYRSHPFYYDPTSEVSSRSPMPQGDSPLFSPDNAGPPPTASATPVMDRLSVMSTAMPLGKYHPSNYKAKTKEPVLERAHTDPQAIHKRYPSDVKRKIHQYQRDIMEQAALAAGISVPGQDKPEGPKLAPLGSPGPVTPFELEESAGYLVAGLGSAARNGDQQELIGRLIEQEKSRKIGRNGPALKSPLRSPMQSPIVAPMR